MVQKLIAFFDDKHRNKWQVAFFLNWALLLFLTLSPSSLGPIGIQHADKLFHIIGFGAFAFFFVLAFPRLKLRWIILLSFCMGIGVEAAQSFIPYRSFSIADMVADLTGILIAVLMLFFLRKNASRR